MFFENFPITLYDVSKDGNQKVVVDILKRVVFRNELRNETSLFYDYIIKDGETPEIVSHRFLGDINYHWILLLLNEVVDPYFQWPMSEASLEDYTSKKYPGGAFYLGNSEGLYFDKDEEVYVSGNKNIRGLVKEWDPTYKKLVLYNTANANFSVGDVLVGKDNGGNGTITRKVDIHSQGVHHFEDSSDDFLYNPLDPMATPPVSGQQVAIGLTGSTWRSGAHGVTFGNTILYSYVNSEDANTTTHSVLTFQEYERRQNEKNRTIKILREDYVENVVEDFKKAINS